MGDSGTIEGLVGRNPAEDAAEFASVEMDAAIIAWEPTLRRKVHISNPVAERTSGVSLAKSARGEVIVVEILLDGEPGGQSFLLFPESLSLVMTGALLMLPPEEIERKMDGSFQVDDFDALTELANHFAGSSASMVERRLKCSADYTLGQVRSMAPARDPAHFLSLVGSGEVVKVSFDFEIEGFPPGKLVRIYTGELAASFKTPSYISGDTKTAQMRMSSSTDGSGMLSDSALFDTDEGFDGSSTSHGTNMLSATPPGLARILGVKLNISVELASKQMTIGEILNVVPGAVLRFPKKADASVNLVVNGKVFASGAAVVTNDRLAFEAHKLRSPRERIKDLSDG